ncbi:porin [Aquamicrobium zhengzhouense]|uniref:Porin n=1 Tax=Aquamicrobium zhengzhouense TaxID=2781738 RepID=A0ABS0SBS3_9HYPH|nr:porin [Aquamicrobium zhengzhouense]MBI1620214.1 porin [Aquamicrobium zhengzhouense]
MNIKSLLLGSAAAAVAVSAQAADAIIIAEPEPMEYVRICDTYGTGFFYIPGTETCLKVGGYVRYEMRYRDVDAGALGNGDNFDKFARFAPTFDARTATEWGTLRSFAEVEFNWGSNGGISGSGTSTNLAHAFISLENGASTFLVGKTDTPYHNRALGGLHNGGIFNGIRGNNASINPTSTGVVSYTFNAGNGLSLTGAVVENENTTEFEPNLEAVVRYSQGWGVIVGAAGYDNEAGEWGGKIGAEVVFNPVTVGLQVQYGSSFDSAYGARYLDGVAVGYAPTSEWSAVGYARAALTDTLTARATVQWFEGFDLGGVEFDDAWQFTGGLEWKPVNGLSILPEMRYSMTEIGGQDVDVIEARLRFERSF